MTACTTPSATPSGTPAPAPTADIKRSKLDVVYSALVDQDVHRVSSKTALEAALAAIREDVRATNGKDDVPTPAFEDTTEAVFSEFKKFAAAAGQLAAKNPQLSAERISRTAIIAMIRTSPDCHTYYFDNGRRIDSRPVRERGDPSPPVPQGASIKEADEAGLLGRMLQGGVAYIRFREFRITGTYDIRKEVRTVLEKAVAMGAKGWLFDLRGNVGGNGPEIIASYFLKGEPGMEIFLKNGSAGISRANSAFRLGDEYQLPIAIVQNDRGGSGPEVFTLFLKENRRATVVGGRSTGCLGATVATPLSDGSQISVAVNEFVGAVTRAKYNNVGIPPDIEANDAVAVEVASNHLRAEIAKGGS